MNGETKDDATQRQEVAEMTEKALFKDEVQDDLSKVDLALVSTNAVNSDNESAEDGGFREIEEISKVRLTNLTKNLYAHLSSRFLKRQRRMLMRPS